MMPPFPRIDKEVEQGGDWNKRGKDPMEVISPIMKRLEIGTGMGQDQGQVIKGMEEMLKALPLYTSVGPGEEEEMEMEEKKERVKENVKLFLDYQVLVD